LRPGEKLTEELVAPSEKLLPTRFEKLSLIEAPPCGELSLLYDIDRLVQTARNNDRLQVFQILRTIDLGFGAEAVRAIARAAAASN
jgi:FlaA1/EpsC-like NDP-sugar epimerase